MVDKIGDVHLSDFVDLDECSQCKDKAVKEAIGKLGREFDKMRPSDSRFDGLSYAIATLEAREWWGN